MTKVANLMELCGFFHVLAPNNDAIIVLKVSLEAS